MPVSASCRWSVPSVADSVKVVDSGQLYKGVRERVTAMVAGLTPEQQRTPVPACPGWTVHDVVAHLAGIVDDALNGRMEGAPGEAWTARQVEAGQGRSTAELLAQWSEQGAAFEKLPLPFQAIADVATHEQDIRGAIGQPGARDNDAIDFVTPIFLDGLAEAYQAQGLGPVTISTDRDAVMVGAANEGPAASLRTTRFELFRARLGRRSRDQVLAMGWTGDPTPYLGHFFAFGPAEHDLVE